MTTTQYLRVFARSWWVVALCVAAGIGIPVLSTSGASTAYSSTSSVVVAGVFATQTGAANAYQATLLAEQRMPTYAAVAKGPELAEAVVSETGADISPSTLTRHIDVTVPENTTVLRVTVTDTDPTRAQQLADAAGKAVVQVVKDVEAVKGRKFDLLRARVASVASPATSVSPGPAWRTPAVGGVIGLLVGLALAVAVSRLDPRLHDPDGVADAAEGPVLGVLPVSRRLLPAFGRGRDRDGALRALRSTVFLMRPDEGLGTTLALTSLRPERYDVAEPLASSLADVGSRVLVVDARLHDPEPGDDGSAGLAAYLAGEAPEAGIDEVSPGVDVVRAGRPGPHAEELLHGPALGTLLRDAAERYDFVLVPTSAASEGSDSLAVSAHCDATVLLVRRGRARTEQLRTVVRRLHGVRARVLGAVLLT